MTLLRVWTRLLTLATLAFWLSGCVPVSDSPADEEKDPHYLAGKNRLNGMDYDGAIAAFENALVSNPKSAAAHLELGLLYEEKKSSYATAIHHYEKHLELRPDSNMAETIKQRIYSCKLDLARTVPLALVIPKVQDEMRRLYATNADLHKVIEQLKVDSAEREAAFSNKLAEAVEALAAARAKPERVPEPEPRIVAPPRPTTQVRSAPPARSTALPRSHLVRSGETLDSISRKYNLKLSALQAANPTVQARRLKAGQILNIPSPGAR